MDAEMDCKAEMNCKAEMDCEDIAKCSRFLRIFVRCGNYLLYRL